METFDIDKLRIAALNYAEKNKIVNQKTITAFIDGFKLLDSKDSDNVLTYLEKVFKSNFDSTDSDIGYSDMRGEMVMKRKQEGLEALELSKEVKELRLKIKNFNTKYNKKY